MENPQKYFAIIENLYKNSSNKNDIEYFNSNLCIIERYIKDDFYSLLKKSCLQSISYVAEENASEDINWKYVTYLLYILLSIDEQIDLNSDNKNELISMQQQECYAFFVNEVAEYGLCPNLLPEIQNYKIFDLKISQRKLNINRLRICLKFLEKMYKIQFLMAGSRIDHVKLLSIAACMSILSSNNVTEEDLNYNRTFIMHIWEHSCKVNYFKSLLILKSISKLPQKTQKILHEDLLEKLQTNIGFKILLEAIIPAASNKAPNWKCFEVVANIISHKGHTQLFYKNLINQIFEFLESAIKIEQQHIYIPGGVLSLTKLYFVNDDTKQNILQKIDEMFKKLYNPEDLITGVILFENNEFLNLLKLLNFLFCGSSFQSLPSEILIHYLPLLVQTYYQITEDYQQVNLIKSLIIQCLSNRKKEELKTLLKMLILENFAIEFKILHPRILFNINEKSNVLNLQISSPEMNNGCEMFISLSKILKKSNNNILIYNSFISILHMFVDENFGVANSDDCHLLFENENELHDVVEKKFKSKFAVISFIVDLVEHKPLHSQFRDNPDEILDFLLSVLIKYSDTGHFSEEKLSILLSIFQEIIENSNNIEKFNKFLLAIQNLLKNQNGVAIKHQLEHILNLLQNNRSNNKKNSSIFEKSEYEIARSLIEQSQPYLKVYGINLLIRLINLKNDEVIINKHTILAIALNTLKDEESYTFLNCVKLFVTLINCLEVEILSILSDEYLSDNNETDYRLKIGETMLKITEELGPMSYKYKSILINCFLSGSRHPLDEFRLSSISNLATICKLLTYQVQSFFQELLLLIESILQTDKYLPAKRAVILVLTQLLIGMDNLLDFQEYLLPIYRILKYIAANDSDNVMRTHANNGLNILGEKCKKLFTVDQNLQKEIKIFGIKDDNKKKNSNFILELN